MQGLSSRSLSFVAVCLLLGGCDANGAPQNLILISIDTLRADHLGCYGYGRPTSPAIDSLAAEGLVFEDVTAPSPWTLPSHASLLTGLYPNRHGIKSHQRSLPATLDTITTILKKQGYDTAAVVNSFHLSERYGLNRGFHHFDYFKERLSRVEPSEVEARAIKWLTEHSADKPFFLFLHFFDLHSDYVSLPRYESVFQRPYTGIADGTTAQLKQYRQGNVALDKVDAKHLIDLYDASIRQMDDGIKRLMQVLENEKLLENTLLVITSDHGEEFLEHGGVLHGRTYYEEVLKVPLILRGPGIPKGRRVKDPASLVDVMPSLLGLLGATIPEGLDGMDLRPAWQQANPKLAPRTLFSEADHKNVVNGEGVDDIKRAVRYTRFKLHYDTLTKKAQLFDLIADPDEQVDVMGEDPNMGAVLRGRLDQYLQIKTTSPALGPLSPQEVRRLKSLGYLR